MTSVLRNIIWIYPIGAVCVVVLLLWIFGKEVAGKIRYNSRGQENLPAVLIEPGHMATCRTCLCDFRFPLPEGTRVVQMDPLNEKELVKGEVNTIEGTIYVASTNGQAVKIPDYLAQATNYERSLNGWLNKAIVVKQTIHADSTGELTAIHFDCMGDSSPLGYY